MLPVVLTECVFVLESFYGHRRADVASALTRLISRPGVAISNLALQLGARNRYQGTSVHFVECLIAATAAAGKYSSCEI